MRRTLTCLLIAAGLIALISGCASEPTPPPDTVTILDVKSSAIPNSEYTRYNVKVAYLLRSVPRAVVTLGFDLEEPGRYIVMNEREVGEGIGEVDVSADVRLPKRDTVTLYADLSRLHHPSQWTSLAQASRELTITK